jgi:hypothetical protein
MVHLLAAMNTADRVDRHLAMVRLQEAALDPAVDMEVLPVGATALRMEALTRLLVASSVLVLVVPAEDMRTAIRNGPVTSALISHLRLASCFSVCKCRR